MRSDGVLESSPQCALSTDASHMQCRYLGPPVFGFPCLLHAREVLAKFCAKRFLK